MPREREPGFAVVEPGRGAVVRAANTVVAYRQLCGRARLTAGGPGQSNFSTTRRTAARPMATFRLVKDRSEWKTEVMPTVIAATEAKAKFSELLERVQAGEAFTITLHGQERASLVPVRGTSLDRVRAVIAGMKTSRSVLNPRNQPRLKLKDLVNEGRS